MTGKIIDGKKIADSILEKVRKDVAEIKRKGVTPKLVVIQVGDDPASTIYVNMKHKKCLELGMASEVKRFPASMPQEELLAEIGIVNSDSSVHGMLVQVPLPKHIDERKILEAVAPSKDVDGLSPENQGRNLLDDECFQPATTKGIMTLLEHTKIRLEGKNAVIIGRSDIVGKPIAVMLLNRGCTITVCHSRTKKLSDFTKLADILVSAVGKPKLVKASMVKKGVVVIDAGISKLPDGRIVGDVDFNNVIKKASWITPVPKGVGPMTIASLMENTIKACRDIEWPRK